MHQSGLFDVQLRHERVRQYASMLDQLNSLINWEDFRQTLEIIRNKERKSNAGRKPFGKLPPAAFILPHRSAAAVACSKF